MVMRAYQMARGYGGLWTLIYQTIISGANGMFVVNRYARANGFCGNIAAPCRMMSW